MLKRTATCSGKAPTPAWQCQHESPILTERLARQLVHQRAVRREHDVVDIELLERVLEVVAAGLGEPVVAEGDRERPQAVDLGQHVQLEGRCPFRR